MPTQASARAPLSFAPAEWRRDLDPTFCVVAISTPNSIYSDLHGREIRHGRAELVEGSLLKQAGLGYMLHPRLAQRADEKWSI